MKHAMSIFGQPAEADVAPAGPRNIHGIPRTAEDRRRQDDELPPAAFHGVRTITSREFGGFQKLVYREAGIHLSEAKRALLVGRLNRRLRELALTSFGDYLEIVQHDAAERQRMLDCICTNETQFFREPAHFEFLERVVVPQLVADAAAGVRQKRVRIWSAGCSSGEEPFSLAMLFAHHLPDWDVQIIATDLSTKILDSASAAVWPIARSANIPKTYLKKFMLRGTGPEEGHMKATPLLRSMVSFRHLNLNDETYGVPKDLDAVFCRNVMIYFDAASKKRVVDRIMGHLARGGHFFVGHAESLSNISPVLQCVLPTVYLHKP